MNLLNIKPLGEKAISVDFPEEISVKRLKEVLYLKKHLEQLEMEGIIEMINAYSSLVIHFNPFEIQYATIVDEIRKVQIPEGALEADEKTKCAIIPVCYKPHLAPDLEDYLERKKLSLDQFVELHAGTRYMFYMYGFVPGFMYFGGLDPRLHCHRKHKPTLGVPSGSVAIGGAQTGVYALNSPGGWHVIGRTPLSLIEINIHGNVIQPGDEVIFAPVDTASFVHIQNEQKDGKYKIDFLE
jgi:inhibitor of KinA